MVTLQNDFLKINIKNTGAELCEISSVKHGTQFMWNANPDIWANYAPNLFPIVGMLKDKTYIYEGKKYHLSNHGFVRNNPNFEIVETSKDAITLKLKSNEDSLKIYPFQFQYDVSFQLKENKLQITYKVKNQDSKAIYFSLGGHPAFKCPVFDHENYRDYELVFEKEETSKTHLLNLQSGLVTDKSKAVFDTPKTIQLHHDLFKNDALIFKDLKSRKVTLKSKKNNEILTVHYQDFPFLGIWAKPQGDYVCIEPWLGIADSESTNQEFTTKESIIKLDIEKEFSASFSIEINKSHLL